MQLAWTNTWDSSQRDVGNIPELRDEQPKAQRGFGLCYLSGDEWCWADGPFWGNSSQKRVRNHHLRAVPREVTRGKQLIHVLLVNFSCLPGYICGAVLELTFPFPCDSQGTAPRGPQALFFYFKKPFLLYIPEWDFLLGMLLAQGLGENSSQVVASPVQVPLCLLSYCCCQKPSSDPFVSSGSSL